MCLWEGTLNKKELKETDKFFVVDEAGNRYQLIEYTEYIHVRAFGEPEKIIEGLKHYQTADAEMVNRIDTDSFKLSVFDETLNQKEIIAKKE